MRKTNCLKTMINSGNMFIAMKPFNYFRKRRSVRWTVYGQSRFCTTKRSGYRRER